MNKPEGTLTIAEVAEKLGGVSRDTAMRRIREAGLRPVRPAKTPFLAESDFPLLLESTKRRGPKYASAPPGRALKPLTRAEKTAQTRRIADAVRERNTNVTPLRG